MFIAKNMAQAENQNFVADHLFSRPGAEGLFVCFDSLRPSQECFSHVGTCHLW